MTIVYTDSVKNSRLDAVTTAIGESGFIEIGTTGMASVLATIPLAVAAAPAAAGGVLSFAMPQSDTAADNSGTAAAARITNAALEDVVTGLTVGTDTSDGTLDIVLDSVSITAGQTVTLNSAEITHG